MIRAQFLGALAAAATIAQLPFKPKRKPRVLRRCRCGHTVPETRVKAAKMPDRYTTTHYGRYAANLHGTDELTMEEGSGAIICLACEGYVEYFTPHEVELWHKYGRAV